MIKVIPKRYENISMTLRRLRKICEREGVMRDLRRKMYYEKPSEKRRRDKMRSIKRHQKEEEEKAQDQVQQKRGSSY